MNTNPAEEGWAPCVINRRILRTTIVGVANKKIEPRETGWLRGTAVRDGIIVRRDHL